MENGPVEIVYVSIENGDVPHRFCSCLPSRVAGSRGHGTQGSGENAKDPSKVPRKISEQSMGKP